MVATLIFNELLWNYEFICTKIYFYWKSDIFTQILYYDSLELYGITLHPYYWKKMVSSFFPLKHYLNSHSYNFYTTFICPFIYKLGSCSHAPFRSVMAHWLIVKRRITEFRPEFCIRFLAYTTEFTILYLVKHEVVPFKLDKVSI